MQKLITKISLAGALVAACSGAFAGNFTQVPDPQTVAQGATANVAFQFAGDGATQEAQMDLNYNNTVFTTVVPTVVVAGSVCAVFSVPAPFIRVVPPSGAGNPLTSTATTYCSFAFTAAAAAPAANYDFTTRLLECDGPSCTRTGPFRITVTAGVTPTPPNIAYNPATGTTITYAGAGTASPIVATPSGGAGSGAAATTTVGACTITAGGAAFPTTNIAQLSFVGPTVTPQNIVLPNCVPQAAQVDATLTCPQSLGGAAATNQVWTLRCPAAAVGAVPPTLTYNPAPGSSNNVAAGAPLTIGVGCPTDGSACTGSGTGLAATARLENLTATYAGPMFSPVPSMACAFVNEGGTPTGGGTLDFVAGAADPGDIRCTCPANTTSLPTEPFTVSVLERSPASGGTTVARSFTIVCGAPPPVCGTVSYVNQAPGATIGLTNGGAASPVSTVSLNGGSTGVSQTISCVTSNVSAGSTFTVTTNPTPLVVRTLPAPALGGSISAACTNSAETTGTATLTCTGTSATQGCTSTATFTLSCPGQAAPPPPSEFVPVPALNEQGRILLAALVLLMGLGVVGFRMRG